MSVHGRDHDIEQSMGVLLTALRDIATRNDCAYDNDPPDERPRPCPCARCVARQALDVTDGGWRFVGARVYRMETNARERKIVAAWRKLGDDRMLAQILADATSDIDKVHLEPPTPRDWYVATSVIQWLATNVGSSILNEAGWAYQEYDADRAEREKREKTTKKSIDATDKDTP
jgi:hypothetical protein